MKGGTNCRRGSRVKINGNTFGWINNIDNTGNAAMVKTLIGNPPTAKVNLYNMNRLTCSKTAGRRRRRRNRRTRRN